MWLHVMAKKRKVRESFHCCDLDSIVLAANLLALAIQAAQTLALAANANDRQGNRLAPSVREQQRAAANRAGLQVCHRQADTAIFV